MRLKISLLFLLWSLLWVVGSFWAACGLQRDLQRQAAALLAEKADAMTASTRLNVVARGQTLVLQGLTHRQSDKQRAIQALQHAVRLQGVQGYARALNPVRTVVDAVVFEPKPSGWGLLAAAEDWLQLQGVTGSEYESQAIASSVSGGGQWSRFLRNGLESDADACIESDQLQVTTSSALDLADERRPQGVLAFARWGTPWRTLDLDWPLEKLHRSLVEAGLPAEAWLQGVSVTVEKVRDAHFAWRAAQAERQRLLAQPPGHLVLAVSEDVILLRGQLGTSQLCTLVADTVRKAAGNRKVVNALVHDNHRRPETDAMKLAATLPDLPGGLLAKMLAVGTVDVGWKRIDLASVDVEDERSLGIEQLPRGLDPRLVLPDVLAAITWMHSSSLPPEPKPSVKPLPHLLLAAAGDRVMVRGRVAEEAVRAQIDSAVRKLYSSRSVDVSIQLDPSCEPVANVLPTLSALPVLPAMNSTGWLALAVPGGSWHGKPLQPSFLEIQGLADSGLLPDGVTTNQVMTAMLDITDLLQSHLQRVLNSAPGIPLQSPKP